MGNLELCQPSPGDTIEGDMPFTSRGKQNNPKRSSIPDLSKSTYN